MPIQLQHQVPLTPNPWARPDPYLGLALLGAEVAIAYHSQSTLVQAVCAGSAGLFLLLAILLSERQ